MNNCSHIFIKVFLVFLSFKVEFLFYITFPFVVYVIIKFSFPSKLKPKLQFWSKIETEFRNHLFKPTVQSKLFTFDITINVCAQYSKEQNKKSFRFINSFILFLEKGNFFLDSGIPD
jgi:hypothetical protein